VVVLEASGLSDPHGIAQIALTNPALRLAGTVTVVDAVGMRDSDADPMSRELFRAQLAAADLLVLNKLDLLEPSQQDAAEAWLAERAPERPVLRAQHAQVPADVVLGLPAPRHAAGSAVVAHLRGFEAWSATCPGLLDEARLHRWLQALPAAVVRAKGVLWLASDPPAPIAYQRVGRRWSLDALPQGHDPAGAAVSRIVVIGPAGLLDTPALQAGLQSCLSDRALAAPTWPRSGTPTARSSAARTSP
jgi:G3E family GTPase